MQDVQSAWALLLQSEGSRANYLLRVVRPDLVRSFAERHNRGLWQCLARPVHDLDDQEPGVVRHRWQHEAASRVERDIRERRLMPRLADHESALLRSQSGPFAGLAFCTAPASFLTRIDSHLFQVLLLRRFRLPLPLSVRTCRCGRLLDPFGHHQASCSRAGVLGRRGFAVERAAARICREGGARVTVNMLVRDMDLPCAERTRHTQIGNCG